MNFGTIQVADIFVGALNAIEAYFGTEKVWEQSAPPTANWLCFTAEEANSTVSMAANGSAPTVSLEYSTDGNTWSPFVVGTTTVTLANIGDKVYVRATSAGNTGMGSSTQNYNNFVMTGKIAASGNLDTLLDQNGNPTLTDFCYYRMFRNCSSLTTAPELPATTLASDCYYAMFANCSALTTAPELPATSLANNCYGSLFYGCTSLTSAPQLPATTLAGSCYFQMFYNCTSLTSAPSLPATTITASCYHSMFSGCSSLTTAPALPATTLANDCYNGMFRNCSNLNSITLGYTGNFSSTYFTNWVNGVASTGIFYYGGPDTTTGTSAIPVGWTIATPLFFTAEEANSTVRLDKVGSPNAISLETSTDNTTWTDYTWSGNTGATLTLANVGDKVYMRAKTTNQAIGSSAGNYHKFVMTGKIAARGNVDTLLDKSGVVTLTNYCYANLFNGCTSLTSAPRLPATTLATYCYYGMFQGCTSLTSSLALPATTLAASCYYQMFANCSSLTTAPELPATTLVDGCYAAMFQGCSSLTTAPELPSTTLATNCYIFMFQDCSNLNSITLGYTGNFADAPSGAFDAWVDGVASTGTFYYDGTDTTTGENAIPTGWTSLPIPRPELCFTAEEANSTVSMAANGSAPTVSLEYSTNGASWSPFVVGTTTVTLANIGDRMYVRATSAGNTGMGISTSNYNKFVMTGKIAASGNVDTLLDRSGNATLTNYCYVNLFYNCTSLTAAPALPATTLATYCYRQMFSGCTSLTSAPDLPATTLVSRCYQSMFYNCSSLTTAPLLPATTLVISCYQTMFNGCSNLNSITLGYTGNFADAPSGAFSNWVNGVAASGTFYYNGSDTTRGMSAIPSGWTITPFTS